MSFLHNIGNIFSTDLRKVVLVCDRQNFATYDLESISEEINKGARTFVVTADRILFFNSMVDMWEANQILKRWKRKGINIVFHAKYEIDILALAAISSVYPIYLNKYAEVNLKYYTHAPELIKSDIRTMLGHDATYQLFTGESPLTATEVNSMKLITGISERNFAFTIAASLLPQPQEASDARFCDMETLKNVFND